jgi:hypothetical protein
MSTSRCTYSSNMLLCTRVQSTTYEDKQKLQRVLGYLKGMIERKLLLHAQKEKTITRPMLMLRTQCTEIQNHIAA